MIRRGEDFWRKAIEQQRASGLNATRFCRKRSLKRGTFLRWRRRLAESVDGQDFVEIPAITMPFLRPCGDRSLEVQIGRDIQITVQPDSDLELVGRFIAAVRSVS
jgi:hypothetical protein